MNIDELKPASNLLFGMPKANLGIIAKPKHSTQKFAFLRKPIIIARSNAISESILMRLLVPRPYKSQAMTEESGADTISLLCRQTQRTSCSFPFH